MAARDCGRVRIAVRAAVDRLGPASRVGHPAAAAQELAKPHAAPTSHISHGWAA